jgi:hypothetical protein
VFALDLATSAQRGCIRRTDPTEAATGTGIDATCKLSRGGPVMALTQNSICSFGWKARDFALKGTDGKSYSLTDVRGPKGTLVVFICNHCPYVKASIGRIVSEATALSEIGIGTIAIMPNDTATYREDSFDNMKAFAAKHRFTFPLSTAV